MKYRSRDGRYISAVQIDLLRALIRHDRNAAERAYDAGQQAEANRLHARADELGETLSYAEAHPA